jgi:hypothetical protein
VRAGGGKAVLPTKLLLTAALYGPRATSATICPVLAMRLRLPDGRGIVDDLKQHMQSRNSGGGVAG